MRFALNEPALPPKLRNSERRKKAHGRHGGHPCQCHGGGGRSSIVESTASAVSHTLASRFLSFVNLVAAAAARARRLKVRDVPGRLLPSPAGPAGRQGPGRQGPLTLTLYRGYRQPWPGPERDCRLGSDWRRQLITHNCQCQLVSSSLIIIIILAVSACLRTGSDRGRRSVDHSLIESDQLRESYSYIFS